MTTKNLNTQEGLGWLWTKVKSAMSGKVDKINGKGLSTNDYTNEDKDKVDSILIISQNDIDTLFLERKNNHENHRETF